MNFNDLLIINVADYSGTLRFYCRVKDQGLRFPLLTSLAGGGHKVFNEGSLTLINLLLPSSCQRAAGLALRAAAGTPEGAAAGRHDHRSH